MPAKDLLAAYNHDQLTAQHRRDSARWVVSLVATGGAPAAAAAYYVEHWPRTVSTEIVRAHLVALETKALVAPGSTTDPAWAQPLVSPKALTEAFLTIVRPAEVVSQLTGVRTVPVQTPIPIWNPTSPSSATWVAQNAMKNVAAFAFGSTTLTGAKIQCGCVVSKELLKLALPGSEDALNDILAFHIGTGVNQEFLDPTRAAVLNTRPGSVTNAGTLVTTANDPVVDAKAVLAALIAARPQTTNPTLVMDTTAASAIINTNLQPQLTLTGGTAFGAAVIVAPAAGKTISAIDPSAIVLNDAGVDFDGSKQSLVALDSAPAAAPDANTVYVSLFQQNLIALRAERFITWKLTAATAVQYTTRA